MADDQSRNRRIRKLNDQFRQEMPHGRVIISAGVSMFSNDQLAEITQAICAFDAFGAEIDPLNEHDNGTLEYAGIELCWVIDACGEYREFISPDPADERVTRRFLLIMLKDEAQVSLGLRL